MGCVYKATNKVNSKIYIGKTIGDFENRKYQHIFDSLHKSKSYYFQNAIRKYGADNFEWEILYKSDSNDELSEKEKEYIKLYNSHGNAGYNLTDGGEGTIGYKYTKEQREKMSSIQKILNNAPERKICMSKRILKYRKENPEFCNILANAARKKLQEEWEDDEYIKMQKSRCFGGKNPAAVKIVCVETKKIYDCIKDAANELNVGEYSIRMVLDHPVRKSKSSLHWVRYSTWIDNNKMEDFLKLMNDSLKEKPKKIYIGEGNCPICGKHFIYQRDRPSQLTKIHCSRSCANKSKHIAMGHNVTM